MTARLSSERWRAVSSELDRAPALDPGIEREQWLADLRARDPELASDVEALLADRAALERDRFLEGSTLPRPDSSLSGLVLGAYTLRSPIGHGGMGSVWLAERTDGRFQSFAAVKLLDASRIGRDGEARFRREGEILARLQHPHIARLMDAGLSPTGQPYLVLERVDGEPIDRYCDRRRLTIEGRIRLFLDVVDALAHAHAHLIVHRDLKPSNVLVDRHGEVKLLDFGIAKLLDSDGETKETLSLTREGERALTPEFAAPEQLQGGPVTTATDVYSLGLLLYILLGGRHPAGAGIRSLAQVIESVVSAEPPRLSEACEAADVDAAAIAENRGTTRRRLKAQLRGDLDNIVAKAMKKGAAERYASVEAFADDLRRYAAHRPVSARPDSLGYRTAKFARRNPAALALAAVALLAFAGGLLGTTSQARRADDAARSALERRDFALRQLSRAEALNDLNTFLLSDAAPLGKPFTVGELLRQAESIVANQEEDPLDTRVVLLVAIGRQYQMTEEIDRARRVLTRAFDLSRGARDVSTRAEAGCALASVLALGDEGERGERIFRDSVAELPDEPRFALHRILCLMRGSEVAQNRGEVESAVERAEAGERLLEEVPFASGLLRFRVKSAVAESYRYAGRNREAAEVFEEAFSELEKLGRAETERAGTILNNWGLSLYVLGQPLAAERLLRRAMAISSPDGNVENISPMLLNNQARALRELDQLDEAALLAERADAKARLVGHETVVHQALLLRASIYRLLGEHDRAEAMLDEVEPRLRRTFSPGHIVFAITLLERALLAHARGEPKEAMALMLDASALMEASGQRSGYQSLFLLRRSEIELDAGRVASAEVDAREALRIDLERIPPGTYSSYVGFGYLALGRALRAQGGSSEACEAFASAAEHLEPALGPLHAATRRAGELAAPCTPGPRN